MSLIEFIKPFPNPINPDETWSAVGPEAETFWSKFVPNGQLQPFSQDNLSHLNGLLMIGALSTTPEPESRLARIVNLMPENSTLLVIDWQDDGPLNYGPDLDDRFKKGYLRRLLRESGFGVVETIVHHPLYYIVKAIKGPPPPIPHAGEFVDVAGLDELPKNAMKPVEIFGHRIIVANTGKEIVAFAQICPHANGDFHQGLLRGRNVVCPIHAYIWNVRTGEPVEPANEDILRRYPVRVESGRVFVAPASL